MKGSERPKATTAVPESPAQVELGLAPGRGTRAAQLSLVIIAIIMIGAALREMSAVAIPVMAALVTGLTLGPVADRLGRLGVPAFLIALGLVVALALFLAIAFVLLAAPLSSWIERAPEIGQLLRSRLEFLLEPLKSAERIQEMIKGSFGVDKALAVEMAGPSIGQSIVITLSPAVGQILIFIGTLFFILLSRERMRKAVVLAFSTREKRLTALKVFAGIQQDLGHYFGTITLINAGLAVLVGVALAVIGLSNPALWAVVAFAFNFVPYVGPIITACLLAFGGLLSFDELGWALAPPLVYILLHATESQFVTPALLGKRFDVSPLIVFLAIVLGTWMWGAIGAFLAAPLLVIGMNSWTRIVEQDRPYLPE
jgi:predicted PurR-regulated permease PerM